MMKKYQQGRLPSGVTLESLINSQGGGRKSSSGTSLTACVVAEEEVQVDSLMDACRELEQLLVTRSSPTSHSEMTAAGERFSALSDSDTGSAVLTIADYREKDMGDVFDELTGLYHQKKESSEPELSPGEIKYTKVRITRGDQVHQGEDQEPSCQKGHEAFQELPPSVAQHSLGMISL
jgi:hypothetical protein